VNYFFNTVFFSISKMKKANHGVHGELWNNVS